MKKLFLIALMTMAVSFLPVTAAQAGSLFVAGHDADDHSNTTYGTSAMGAEYVDVALGFVGASTEVAYFYEVSNGVTMASNINAELNIMGYNLNAILVGSAAYYDALAGGYDTILVGSGFDAIASTGVAQMTADATLFENYFNDDNNLVVLSDQTLGQSYYDFLPSFGTTTTNTISEASAFTSTAEGLGIGLTNAIVDGDITHSTFTNVDSAFTVFETYDPTGAAVAIGFTGTIACDPTDPNAPCWVPPTGVPEPSTLLLLGFGMLGLLAFRRRQSATEV